MLIELMIGDGGVIEKILKHRIIERADGCAGLSARGHCESEIANPVRNRKKAYIKSDKGLFLCP